MEKPLTFSPKLCNDSGKNFPRFGKRRENVFPERAQSSATPSLQQCRNPWRRGFLPLTQRRKRREEERLKREEEDRQREAEREARRRERDQERDRLVGDLEQRQAERNSQSGDSASLLAEIARLKSQAEELDKALDAKKKEAESLSASSSSASSGSEGTLPLSLRAALKLLSENEKLSDELYEIEKQVAANESNLSVAKEYLDLLETDLETTLNHLEVTTAAIKSW